MGLQMCGPGARAALMAASPTDPQAGTTLAGAGHRSSPRPGAGPAGGRPAEDTDDLYWPESQIAEKAKAVALDSLRALGILRKRVDRPVVGRKAYVRWWERVRALAVLAVIVAGLGVALAAVIGVSLIVMGTFLEQAVS